MVVETQTSELSVESWSGGDLPAQLRADWETVREKWGFDAPNSEPQRYLTTTEALPGDQPLLMIVRRGDEPCGMLLARLSERRLKARIGYIRLPMPKLRCMDVVYGGLICDGSDDIAAILIEQIESRLSDGSVDHVMVNHIPIESALFPKLERFAKRRGSGSLTKQEPHWRFRLVPCDPGETMKSFSSKHRRNIRKWDRRLTEEFGGDLETRIFTTAENLDELVAGTEEIARATYQAGLGVAFSDTPTWRARLRSEAAEGILRSYWLVGAGKPIAFFLGKMCGNVYVPDVTGFRAELRDLSPGTVLLTRIFEDLAQQGATAVDYGFGEAHYKRMYGTDCTQEATPLLFSRSWPARVSRTALIWASGADALGKRILDRGDGIKRVKRWWRQRIGRTQVQKTSHTSDGEKS